MRILADENMPAVAELFGGRATSITRAPGRAITAQQLQQIDMLLVRSVTRVTAELLSGSPVRFVGSATIGTDHVDMTGLAEMGVAFAHAPGCNADSVVDYALAALCERFADRPDQLPEQRVAVIGAGEVGGRLVRRLRAIGLSVVVHDPPRQAAGVGPAVTLTAGDFVSLEEAFRCDIVCCHTPLTRGGPHPTEGLVTPELVRRLPDSAMVLNAGRGRVTPAAVVRQALLDRPDVHWVLDVWDPEPAVPEDLLHCVTLATGHIAGYALDGRIRGSWMVLKAAADWAGWPAPSSLSAFLPLPERIHLDMPRQGDAWPGLVSAVRQAYPVRVDHQRFVNRMTEGGAGAFDPYRKQYPERREFAQLHLSGASGTSAALLGKAGFRIP